MFKGDRQGNLKCIIDRNLFLWLGDQNLAGALYALTAAIFRTFCVVGTASSARSAGTEVMDSIAPQPLISIEFTIVAAGTLSSGMTAILKK